MPRVSFSNDYLLDSINLYAQHPSVTTDVTIKKQPSILSPNEIDEILSRKLHEQIKTTSEFEENKQKTYQTLPINQLSESSVDSELLVLIDRFFNLTYLNTIPMVHLLSTAVATNFLKENIRTLDKKLKEQQQGTSFVCEYEKGDDDDDSLSWVSAPT